MRVAVFGATGVIGRALLPLLEEHDLVKVSRSERDEPGWSVADVATGQGVARVLDGVEVAYYLVHSLGTHDFERLDREAAANVSRAAAAAGVRQIVYLGGLGGEDVGASAHLRSRRETGVRLAAAPSMNSTPTRETAYPNALVRAPMAAGRSPGVPA